MADPFDQLLTLLHPDRLLRDPRATGAGVRIAILDSGVERSALEAKFSAQGTTIESIEGGIFVPDRAEPLPYTGRQSAPHGTTVADIILTLAPRVRLFSADVFGPQGGCEVETVVKALHWAIDHWKCKIVNLSLGVPEAKLQPVQRRNALLRAVEEAYYRDVLVFAAAHNEHPLTRSYPAAFAPALVSVNKGRFDDPLRFAYALSEQIEFQAFSKGYLGPFAAEPATSWATPHLAAISAKILSLRRDLKLFELKAILYWMFQAAQQNGPLES
ncbi:MAG TPA: S8 family serine peptidase [Gemmataceae bacterium]|nr:S8 family serine peptidase [Gemmataceae bacterium]